MIGIGLDAVELDRFRRVVTRTPRVVDRVFTESERAYGQRASDPVPRLAARLAAKEAAMKALGVGLGAFSLHDVEVIVDPRTGAPRLAVGGAAAALATERGVTEWQVSLSHTERTAYAVVVAL
jgi:holo-[acyl-carrier protein] synthase